MSHARAMDQPSRTTMSPQGVATTPDRVLPVCAAPPLSAGSVVEAVCSSLALNENTYPSPGQATP